MLGAALAGLAARRVQGVRGAVLESLPVRGMRRAKDKGSRRKEEAGSASAGQQKVQNLRDRLIPAQARKLPKISAKEEERRALLAKAWSRAKTKEAHDMMRRLKEIAVARDEALAKLQEMDAQLHAQAMEIDTQLFPLTFKPMTETPAKTRDS